MRIAYVTSEFEPLLVCSAVSSMVKNLAMGMQDKGAEVRIFMPKYGTFDDKRSKLHQINRLSGLNITVGDTVCELIVKSTSLQDVKLQLYLIDGEMFREKQIFNGKNGAFLKNNDMRSIFFCRGIWETLFRLGWFPNVMHCCDWFSVFVPVLFRYVYQDLKEFKNTKTILSFYNNFPEAFTSDSLFFKLSLDKNSKNLNEIFLKENCCCSEILQLGVDCATVSVYNGNFDAEGNTYKFVTKNNLKFIPEATVFEDFYSLYQELSFAV